MKVALLVAGYLRTFKECIQNIQSNVLDKYHSVDIYIHITKRSEEQDQYLNPQDESEMLLFVMKTLNPHTVLIDDNHQYDQSISQVKQNAINAWTKFIKLNTMKQFTESSMGKRYDIVIKTRPDLCLLSDIEFCNHENMIHIPKDTKLGEYREDMCTNVFAYGPSKLMDEYFHLSFEEMTSQPEHQEGYCEKVLHLHLNKKELPFVLDDIEYNLLLSRCNLFAICGDSGTGKSTLCEYLKACFKNSFNLECDRYHRWERGHENWNHLTHLDPSANYLLKMEKDIFDLKVGNTIYHVDYDHSSGKFTDTQAIESSENMFVCGLHSLYPIHANKYLYNLSIFLEADDDVRYERKILRDAQTRGKSVDEVMAQIRSRQEDYQKHILPQRDIADIIVRFVSNTQAILTMRESWNLPASKLETTANKLRSFDILHTYSKTETPLKVTYEFILKPFDPAKTIPEIPANIKRNNVYDYIVFCIMNLS